MILPQFPILNRNLPSYFDVIHGHLNHEKSIPWLSIPTCQAPARVAARLGNPRRMKRKTWQISRLVHGVFDSKNLGFQTDKMFVGRLEMRNIYVEECVWKVEGVGNGVGSKQNQLQKLCRGISGLVAEYIIAIDMTWARFPADAYCWSQTA